MCIISVYFSSSYSFSFLLSFSHTLSLPVIFLMTHVPINMHNITLVGSRSSYQSFELKLIMLLLELKTWLTCLFSAAGWKIQRCQKNYGGHCRRQCLHTERYKFLCTNKQTCCIPTEIHKEYAQTSTPPPAREDVTVELSTWNFIPQSPISGFHDEITIYKSTTRESTVTGTITPKTNLSSQALVHPSESTNGTTK